MPYHEIMQEVADRFHCYTEMYPTGTSIPTYDLKMGKSIREAYPDDPFTVTFKLHPDLTGLKLGSIIGNAGRLILLHRDVAAALRQHVETGPVDIYPFALINEKGRVHSKDYVIFNPLTIADCLDLEASEIYYNRDGSVGDITEMILDADKLSGLPDIIRVQEYPSRVLFSDTAVAYIEAQGYTNFRFGDPLPQTSRNGS